jgi:hypothetical protein
MAGLAAAAEQETHGNGDYPTAYTALRLVGKTLGADAINHVVSLSGHDGKPQPATWKIVLKDGEGSKEVEVVNGKIEAQRSLARPATGAPIKLPDLNLDSSGAFEASDTQARKVHVRFDSINYTLRTSDKTGKPLWSLDLFNQSGATAGTMKIAADNGAVTALEGRIATNAPAAPAKTVATAGTPAPKPTPDASVRVHPTPVATPRATPAVVAADRTTVTRPLAGPPVTTETTTVTTMQTAPVQTAIVDVPDAGEPSSAPPEDGGGFFARAGRTLDHTTQSVNHSLDHAGQDVSNSVRRAGASIQRFFTGHSSLDNGEQPATPQPPQQD